MDPESARPADARERASAWLFAAAALGLLLALQLLEPFFFLRDDNATHFLGAYTYAAETVAGGELPLLNQHQFLGNTFLAAGQTGVFLAALHPLAAALRLLGVDGKALIDALATLHLWLGGLGMLLLLRHLGVHRGLTWPLALGWCLSPFGVVVSRSWIFVSYLFAFLPWSTWLLLRFLERPTARRGAALVLVKALFLLTGYVQSMVIASFFELAFLAARWLRERRRLEVRREGTAVAAVFLLTALLAAPLLLPLYQAKNASAERAERIDATRALSFAVGPIDFARTQLLLPRPGALFRQGSSAPFYLGLPLLAAVGLAVAWRRRLPADVAAALWAGLFALAMSTLLYYVLYLTPLFASLRWPFKNFPAAAFYLMLAAAGAAAAFAAKSPARARVAAGLAWLNLLLQLILLAVPSFRQPFGPHRFTGTVAELRASPVLAGIGAEGRVIAAGSPRDPTREPEPARLGFLYASLAGKFHLAGYDPLLARINRELAPPTTANTELLFPSDAWPQVRGALEKLSGRYLLVAADSELRETLASDPALRLVTSQGDLLLFELATALPVVFHLEDRAPLPFSWRANGIQLDLPADWPGGHVFFNVAGLDGYRLRVDGEAGESPELLENRPVATLPSGAHRVELVYRDAAFEIGVALALAGLGLLLFALRRDAALGQWMAGAAPELAQSRRQTPSTDLPKP